jgi:uncharacterized protein (DUF1330 family)
VITCCIQYTLDLSKVALFEQYATRWPPIIERCGGELLTDSNESGCILVESRSFLRRV